MLLIYFVECCLISPLSTFFILSVLAIRDALHAELEKLRDDRRYMENDLSHIQLRWHGLREEKTRTGNTLHDLKRVEEELEQLSDEKNQVELDEKVIFRIWLLISFFSTVKSFLIQSCTSHVGGKIYGILWYVIIYLLTSP